MPCCSNDSSACTDYTSSSSSSLTRAAVAIAVSKDHVVAGPSFLPAKALVGVLILVPGIFSSSLIVVFMVALQFTAFIYYDNLNLVNTNGAKTIAHNSSDRRDDAIFPESIQQRLQDSARPIVDHFDEATVLFADISNFTAWSSEKDPADVFHLLEQLYHVFDSHLGDSIYKVETIGDSYLAVAGCPVQDTQHAVKMAHFAQRILQASQDILPMGLKLRVGMHSGPLVAGVLRNHKARYQLFGDTINTASRMESNGIPGRIQISDVTASYLTAAGKASWFHPRNDPVFAKGKGKIQTFWLNMISEPMVTQESVVHLQDEESCFHLEETDMSHGHIFPNHPENSDPRDASCFTLVEEDDTVLDFLFKSHGSFQNASVGNLFSLGRARSESFL